MTEESKYQPGDRVADRYALQNRIGVGAFGEVWRAIDESSDGRNVALKLLHAHHTSSRVRGRFGLEAAILTQLDHPGIARAFDYRLDDEAAFIALEYVEGETLHRRLLPFCGLRDPLAQPGLLEVFRQTCVAVHHAHQAASVVHRDLKPANIMVVGDLVKPSVKVLDFGVAKLLSAPSSDATTKGRVVGTYSYLAPEQITGAEIDHRADIFALGVVLFEILTLRRPWLIGANGELLIVGEKKDEELNDRPAVIDRILRSPRPIITQYRPDLSPRIDEVLRQALAPLPMDRIASARDLAARVGEALAARAPFVALHLPTMSEWNEDEHFDTMIAPTSMDRPEGLVSMEVASPLVPLSGRPKPIPPAAPYAPRAVSTVTQLDRPVASVPTPISRVRAVSLPVWFALVVFATAATAGLLRWASSRPRPTVVSAPPRPSPPPARPPEETDSTAQGAIEL